MCSVNKNIFIAIKIKFLYTYIQLLNRHGKITHIDHPHYLFIILFLYKHTYIYKLNYSIKLIILELLHIFIFKYTLLCKKIIKI